MMTSETKVEVLNYGVYRLRRVPNVFIFSILDHLSIETRRLKMTGELIEKLLISNVMIMLTAALSMSILIAWDAPEWLTKVTLNVLCAAPYIFVAVLLLALWM